MKTTNLIFSIFLLIATTSCGPSVRYGLEAIAPPSPAWGYQHYAYLVLDNGVYIQTGGQTGLWKVFTFGRLADSVLYLKKDFLRYDTKSRTNIIDIQETFKHFGNFYRHNMNSMYWTSKNPTLWTRRIDIPKQSVSKASKNSEVYKKAKNDYKQYTHGQFEFVCNKETYGKVEFDSIGLFNMPSKECAKLRRINGLEGQFLSLLKSGSIYNFHYRMNHPGMSKEGNAMPLLWCRATLPAGIKKFAMPTQRDLIWDYGDNQYLWLHLDPDGTNDSIERIRDLPACDAKQIINNCFPMNYDKNLMDMETVRHHIEAACANSSVRMYTNRCTLISSDFKETGKSFLELLLRKTFVEDDLTIMRIISQIVDNDLHVGDNLLIPPPGSDSVEFQRSLDVGLFLFPFYRLFR